MERSWHRHGSAPVLKPDLKQMQTSQYANLQLGWTLLSHGFKRLRAATFPGALEALAPWALGSNSKHGP